MGRSHHHPTLETHADPEISCILPNSSEWTESVISWHCHRVTFIVEGLQPLDPLGAMVFNSSDLKGNSLRLRFLDASPPWYMGGSAIWVWDSVAVTHMKPCETSVFPSWPSMALLSHGLLIQSSMRKGLPECIVNYLCSPDKLRRSLFLRF